MNVSLLKIKDALIGIEGEGWDEHTINYVDAAANNLKALSDSLESVSVKGRKNMDALLGCMIGIDMIIGEGEDDG